MANQLFSYILSELVSDSEGVCACAKRLMPNNKISVIEYVKRLFGKINFTYAFFVRQIIFVFFMIPDLC